MNVYPFLAGLPSKTQDFSALVKQAKKNFSTYAETYVCNQNPAFILYRIYSNGRYYHGFVGLSNIEDYLDEKIIKHEQTIAEKEQWQIDALKERNALIKPVLLTCQKLSKLDAWLELTAQSRKADFTFKDNGELVHELWVLDDEASISKIKNELDARSHVYIADGHHRTEAFAQTYISSGKSEIYRHFLTAYFSLDNLDIHAYHRMISQEPMLSDAFKTILSLKSVLEIRPMLSYPSHERLEMEGPGMYLFYNDQWMQLTWREEILKEHTGETKLDAELLNEFVLKRIFDCKDIRRDNRIKYLDSTKGTEHLVNKVLKEASIAFLIPRISKSQFCDLLDKKIILPPKSTLFKPRLKNGVVVQFINK
jgi:uncharacterized protein (DUF1015 family)